MKINESQDNSVAVTHTYSTVYFRPNSMPITQYSADHVRFHPDDLGLRSDLHLRIQMKENMKADIPDIIRVAPSVQVCFSMWMQQRCVASSSERQVLTN